MIKKTLILTTIISLYILILMPTAYAEIKCYAPSCNSENTYKTVTYNIGGTVWNDPRYSPTQINNNNTVKSQMGGVIWSDPRYAPKTPTKTNFTLGITQNWTVWHDERYAPDQFDQDFFLIKPKTTTTYQNTNSYNTNNYNTKYYNSKKYNTKYYYKNDNHNKKYYKTEQPIEFKPWRTSGIELNSHELIKIY
ncbi:MAG: hypothetical protein K0B02_05215 [DPANN group archaeon]|nr:hypothetical protein [DPANN group archaeon]